VSPELKPEVIEEDGGDDPHSFAFIPQQIEADWHEKWGPLLEGFPLNILFAAIRNDAQTGQQSVVEVCYWPDVPRRLRAERTLLFHQADERLLCSRHLRNEDRPMANGKV